MRIMVDQGGSKAARFPEKSSVREFSRVEGAGEEMDYPDSEESIRRTQEMCVKKVKENKQKEYFRY